MSSVSGGASYSYNAAGEMTDDDGTTLGWAAFGKAVSVEQGVGGNSVYFAYGPDDARVEKNVVAGGQSETVLYFEGAEQLTEGPHTAIRRTITLADLTFIDTGGAGSHVLYPVTDNLGGAPSRSPTPMGSSIPPRPTGPSGGARRPGGRAT